MKKKTTIILNPIAGGIRNKEKVIHFVVDYFTPKGHEITLKQTSRRGEATKFAQQAVKDKTDFVIAIGGDGTINEVGSGLVNTAVPMGIIPFGSGNGLARSLNIPQKMEPACQLILEENIFSIDVGKANDRYFFGVAGVGFDAVVGKRFNEFSRRGPIPYFYLSAKEFFVYKPEWLKICFDGNILEINPFVIAVANGQQYGNGAIIAPEAKINDGLFDICIVHQLTFLQLFSAIPKLFKGQVQKYRYAEFHKCPAVTIERKEPALIHLDGEPVLDKPMVKILLLTNALNVIASKNSPCLSQ
ncbi:MAG: diacylglycerol/lipid kinase family protein [bacterium]